MPPTNGQQRGGGSAKSQTSAKAPLDPLVYSPKAQAKRRAPWLNFVAAVAPDFTEAELGLMDWTTVRGLIQHIGITDAMDVALVQVHWQQHAASIESKRALVAQQAREAAEQRQREEEERAAAAEKAKRDAEEAERRAAEEAAEAAQRKKLGLSTTARFSSSSLRPRLSGAAASPTTTTTSASGGSAARRRPSASPDARGPSTGRSSVDAAAAPKTAVAAGAAKSTAGAASASPSTATKSPRVGSTVALKPAAGTTPSATAEAKAKATAVGSATSSPKSSTAAAAAAAAAAGVKRVTVTVPVKAAAPPATSTPRAAEAKPTSAVAAAAASVTPKPLSPVPRAASPPASPATRARTAEAKAAAIFANPPPASSQQQASARAEAAAPARTSIELDLFMAADERARSGSRGSTQHATSPSTGTHQPLTSPQRSASVVQVGADGEPLCMNDVKPIFREWCLYSNGTITTAINFGRFIRWMKAIDIVDRHFLQRDAESVFRGVMKQYRAAEAKRNGAVGAADDATSTARCPSVASMASVATGAGDQPVERMPYHVFRIMLLPELASKLRCTTADLVKRFQYCGGPKEPSPKKRVEVYTS